MALLTDQQIPLTYKQLLNLSSSVSSTYQTMTDGLGNDCGLEIKTNQINVRSGWTFTVDGAGLATSLSALSDVAFSGLASNNIMSYNSGTSKWNNITLSTLKSNLSLNNVENTALSTWAGTTNITTLGTISTGTWNGTTLGVGYGGTGQTTYTNGQLLIGNTTGNTLTKATLTQSGGITVTNGGGSITISCVDWTSASADLSTSGKISSSSTAYTHVATGTTAQRDTGGGTGSIRYNTTDGKLEAYNGSGWDQYALSAASGESNTASSVGTGQSLYKSKTGVNLDFYSLLAGSNKITIGLSTSDITVDVNPANITLGSVGGLTWTDGKIPIGKTSDGTLNAATLTAGQGITITNGAASITVADTTVTTKGDIYCYGSSAARLAVGTNGYCLIADSSQSTGLAWAQRARLLQTSYTAYTIATSGSTTIPHDDTIPQNTEGTQLFTVSFTPVSASSTLYMCLTLAWSAAASDWFMGGIWVDSTANALAALDVYNTSSGASLPFALQYSEASGSTSARTYKVRVGDTGGAWGINGNTSGTRSMGGVKNCALIIYEVL